MSTTQEEKPVSVYVFPLEGSVYGNFPITVKVCEDLQAVAGEDFPEHLDILEGLHHNSTEAAAVETFAEQIVIYLPPVASYQCIVRAAADAFTTQRHGINEKLPIEMAGTWIGILSEIILSIYVESLDRDIHYSPVGYFKQLPAKADVENYRQEYTIYGE